MKNEWKIYLSIYLDTEMKSQWIEFKANWTLQKKNKWNENRAIETIQNEVQRGKIR